MDRYQYRGMDPFLMGHTALGRTADGEFQVQVDDFEHQWSHGWHAVPEHQWKFIPNELSDEFLLKNVLDCILKASPSCT